MDVAGRSIKVVSGLPAIKTPVNQIGRDFDTIKPDRAKILNHHYGAGREAQMKKRLVGVGQVLFLTVAVVALGVTSAQASRLEPPITPVASTPVPANLHALVPANELTISRAHAEAALTTQSVEFYEKHFGVSAELAREHLITQAMGNGFAPALRKQEGNNATEVWFDNTTGEWVADSTTPADANINALASSEGIASSYRVQHVAYTRTQLLDAEETVSEKLSSLTKEDLARIGVAEGKIQVTLASGLGTEGRATAQSAATAAAASSPGAPPVATTTSNELSLHASTTVRCLFPFCDTLTGGDMYGTGNVQCTMSWWAGYQGLSGTEHPLMLTAGHCSRATGYQAPDSSCLPYPGGCAVVGINAGWYFGNDGDWSAIAVSYPPPAGFDPEAGRPYGGYINWNSGYTSKLEGYYQTGPAPVGMVVCHQGYGSGVDLGQASWCGTIARNEVQVNYEGTIVERLSEVTGTKVCHGDSGGPWDGASVAVAVGITSGGVIPLGQSCGATAFFTPVWIPIVGWKLVLYGGYSD
jgi:hypothetical protein